MKIYTIHSLLKVSMFHKVLVFQHRSVYTNFVLEHKKCGLLKSMAQEHRLSLLPHITGFANNIDLVSVLKKIFLKYAGSV